MSKRWDLYKNHVFVKIDIETGREIVMTTAFSPGKYYNRGKFMRRVKQSINNKDFKLYDKS